MLQTWLPWLTLKPTEDEQAFRQAYYQSMRPATNWTVVLAVGVILAFALYGLTEGHAFQDPDNISRLLGAACLLAFLAINPLLTTQQWLIAVFVTSVAVMLTMCLAFWSVAGQWGAIGEGGPMLVAMVYGIIPVLHLGHKLASWSLLGVVLWWIIRSPEVEPQWTMFYYSISIIILSIFQLQMDRLMRVRFRAERVEREKAETDQLTGTLNRHAFEQRMADLLAQLEPGDGVVLGMIDIDYFKAYNDQYGHLQGDLALVAVAKALNNLPAELVVRFGGEEFILVARYRGSRPAWVDQVPAHISALEWPHLRSTHGVVTVSMGMVDYLRPANSMTGHRVSVKTLLTVADKQLYQAKAAGRNQVSSHCLATADHEQACA